MNYENRFKRLLQDLLNLLAKHINEWNTSEQGGYDVDEILKHVDLEKNSSPINYSNSKKELKP